MKRTKRALRLLALVLALAMVVFILPVSAEGGENSGTFGSPGGSWNWVKDEAGTKLTISYNQGTACIDGGLDPNMFTGITEIKFVEGITGVEASFFNDVCNTVTKFIFPSSVTSVNVGAFELKDSVEIVGFDRDQIQHISGGGGPAPGEGGGGPGPGDGGGGPDLSPVPLPTGVNPVAIEQDTEKSLTINDLHALDDDSNWQAAYVQFTPSEDGYYRITATATVNGPASSFPIVLCGDPTSLPSLSEGGNLPEGGWNCYSEVELTAGTTYVFRIKIPGSDVLDTTQPIQVKIIETEVPPPPLPYYDMPPMKTLDPSQCIQVTETEQRINDKLTDPDAPYDKDWYEAYFTVTPDHDGVYCLRVSIPEGFNSDLGVPMLPNIISTCWVTNRSSGGHEANSENNNIFMWEFYRLEAGQTYQFRALICKHGIDLSKDVNVVLKEETCTLRPDQFLALDNGQVVVMVKGFYSPSSNQAEGVVSSENSVTINATSADAQNTSSVSVSMEAASVSTLAENNVENLTIQTNAADVSFDGTAVGTMAAPEAEVQLSVSKQESDEDITINLDMVAIDEDEMGPPSSVLPESSADTNGTVTVEVDCELEAGQGVTVEYVKDDGSTEPVESSYDAEDGTVTFTTTHFSTYVITRIDNVCQGNHSFGSYTSNHDATCQKDGTKTATCTVCGVTDTKPDVGSKTSHKYQNGTCIYCGAAEPQAPCDGGDGCPSKDYTDVNQKEWYHTGGYVDYVIAKGVMTGISTEPLRFAPGMDVNRAQMIEALWKMAGSPKGAAASPFTDVDQTAWYAESINWAYAQGIAKGIGGNLFAPSDKLTREQMVTFLYRYAVMKGQDVSASEIPAKLSDRAQVSDYAKPAMEWAVQHKIITGMGTSPETIAPSGISTRAQLAKILTVFLQMTN